MTEGTPTDLAPSALVAELWFEQAPDLSDPQLLDALRALSPDAEAQQDSLTVPYRSSSGNGQVETFRKLCAKGPQPFEARAELVV